MYKILFVDDDALLRSAVASALAAEGFEVVTGAAGKDCPALAANERPDLIILDVQLLDADGVEVCRRLKADCGLRHIPVILLTGTALAVGTRVAGLDAGADDYLFKPVSPKVLSSRIRNILRAVNRSRP